MTRPNPGWANPIWIWIAALVGGSLGLRLAGDTIMGLPTPAPYAGVLATGLMLLCMVFLLGFWRLQHRMACGWVSLFWIGLALRLVWLNSAPIFEDDAWRYLWDGGLVARGLNPYAYAPQMLTASPSLDGDLLEQRFILAQVPGAQDVFTQINHAHLATIYPPLAQAVFAFSHWLAPYSLLGWQLVLLGVDIISFGLMAWLIDKTKTPRVSIVLYWWNPLLIQEFINSLHMDLLLLPLLTGVLLAAYAQRAVWGSVCLALAAGIKVWPLVLWPATWPLKRLGWPKTLILGSLCLALAALVFAPILINAELNLDRDSGITAYAKTWEMNDALFMLIKGLIHQGLGQDIGTAQTITRWLVAFSVAGLSLWFWSRPTPTDPAVAMLAVASLLLLLSPTGFPWYYIWLFPALVLRPVWPLLWLTALLPLYYWRFAAKAQGWEHLFHQAVVWLEFAPVLAGLALIAAKKAVKKLDQPTT